MRAFLAAVALALLPSSLLAASITFEQPFHFEEHASFSGFPGEGSVPMKHFFRHFAFTWDVPVFDPALGTSVALDLHLVSDGGVAWAIDPPDTEIQVHLFLIQPFMDGLAAPFGETGGTIVYAPGSPPYHWFIGVHPDSHAFFDIRASATVDFLIAGVARATYLYEPAAVTAVPEPISLFLLGSGLAAGYYHRVRARAVHGYACCDRESDRD